jgi:hypothetical protein
MLICPRPIAHLDIWATDRFKPARTALSIRLDTPPVRWPEEGTQICDPHYGDSHRTPRQNIVVPVVELTRFGGHLILA